MRVVLDTNILISALGWLGNEHEILRRCFNKELILLLSSNTIEEFKNSALNPKLKFTKEEIDEFISALVEISELFDPEAITNIILEDPSDNKFLDLALVGKADYIITGDLHLLKLKEFKKIRILKSSEFLKLS